MKMELRVLGWQTQDRLGALGAFWALRLWIWNVTSLLGPSFFCRVCFLGWANGSAKRRTKTRRTQQQRGCSRRKEQVERLRSDEGVEDAPAAGELMYFAKAHSIRSLLLKLLRSCRAGRARLASFSRAILSRCTQPCQLLLAFRALRTANMTPQRTLNHRPRSQTPARMDG